MARYIMGIDQGTTLTKVIIFDRNARILASSSVENKLYFPQPGWIEQDPEEIFESTLKAAREAFKNSRIVPEDIEAIGITSQLTTTIFWNKNTGEAVGRAISWQDNRATSIFEALSREEQKDIERRTGMHIFPTFSVSKIRWLMENDRTIQKGIAREELLFGTVDSWLIWKLSGGQAHVTDFSNACLTLLLNSHTLSHDKKILDQFGIPIDILPELHSSSEIYAYTSPEVFFDVKIPIAGNAGDQFSPVLGQACYQPGSMMCNIGTGTSLILNTGDRIFTPEEGMDSPILWTTNGNVVRGMSSWANVSGAALQWFRDELGFIKDISEAEMLAFRVSDTQGVYFVPAFAGLTSPIVDPYCRGTFFGITQSTSKNHMVRSALEAMAYQVKDSFDVMEKQSGEDIKVLHVGGGGAKNEFLLQFLADMLGIVIERPVITESSGLGAAFLAGLTTGFWDSIDEIQNLVHIERRYSPGISVDQREELYYGWKKAIKRSIGWLKE